MKQFTRAFEYLHSTTDIDRIESSQMNNVGHISQFDIEDNIFFRAFLKAGSREKIIIVIL